MQPSNFIRATHAVLEEREPKRRRPVWVGRARTLVALTALFPLLTSACKSGSPAGAAGHPTPGTSTAGGGGASSSTAGATGSDGAGANGGSVSGGGAGATLLTCSSGFVACNGLCLEKATVGADCAPLECGVGHTPRPASRSLCSGRGFDFHVTTAGDKPKFVFIAGTSTCDAPQLSPTLSVQVHYRINHGPVVSADLMPDGKDAGGNNIFDLEPSGIAMGDSLDFYFTQVADEDHINNAEKETDLTHCGQEWCRADTHWPDPRFAIGKDAGPDSNNVIRWLDVFPTKKPVIDSAWFHQVVGQPDTPEPDYPLVTSIGARFRNRHPNEWAFDQYVTGYNGGRSFDFTITDHGTSLDFAVNIDPAFDLSTLNTVADANDPHFGQHWLDIKFFDGYGPTPFCNGPPAQSEIGQRMFQDPSPTSPNPSHTFKYTLDNVTYGELIDAELTFTRPTSITYYTEFFHYRVGAGRIGRKWQDPRAYAASEASVTRVSTNQFAFAQHIPTLSQDDLLKFFGGKIIFESDFDSHTGTPNYHHLHNLPTQFNCGEPDPAGSIGEDAANATSPLFMASDTNPPAAVANYQAMLGPAYSESSCFNCHRLDGKGSLPDASGLQSMLIKMQSSSTGGVGPDPQYGSQFDHQAIPGGAAEGAATVSYQTSTGAYKDGTSFTLRKPVVTYSNLAHGAFASTTNTSLRVPPAVSGLGLLEEVPDGMILGFADPDDKNGDGISGKPNMVLDEKTGKTVLGRFGWKASQPSVRQQAATALFNDMGITSSLLPGTTPSAGPEFTDKDLDLIEAYLTGLTVPPRPDALYKEATALEPSKSDPDYSKAAAFRVAATAGKALFENAGCGACHVPNLMTSTTSHLAGTSALNIQPFTDLLLHDMGPDLADSYTEFEATGAEWRTAPLWGAGMVGDALAPPSDINVPSGYGTNKGHYLHDGRAATIEEAILWHGGEALKAKNAVLAMTPEQRQALFAYTAYPYADPLPVPVCAPGYEPWASAGK